MWTPEEDESDKDLLEQTLTSLRRSHQVDAKMKLAIMSRRPFSSMRQEITLNEPYAQYFIKVMSRNRSFTSITRVPHLYGRTNYAEQFFVDGSGQPRDLRSLSSYIEDSFLSQNRETLESLLREGIVSTTILRNFKQEVQFIDSFSSMAASDQYYLVPSYAPVRSLFDDYFREAIISVEFPNRRCILDSEALKVECIPCTYDALSPPPFLSPEDSMGRLKEDLRGEEKEYGEAIVEIRAVKNLQSWALKKMGLSADRSGEFLRNNIGQDGIRLFRFLKDFGTEAHETEIFYLGLPFALKKF